MCNVKINVTLKRKKKKDNTEVEPVEYGSTILVPSDYTCL